MVGHRWNSTKCSYWENWYSKHYLTIQIHNGYKKENEGTQSRKPTTPIFSKHKYEKLRRTEIFIGETSFYYVLKMLGRKGGEKKSMKCYPLGNVWNAFKNKFFLCHMIWSNPCLNMVVLHQINDWGNTTEIHKNNKIHKFIF